MKSARENFIYTDDDLIGYRKGHMKYVYAEQRLPGTMGVWAEPFTELRLQKIYSLMQDPFERADITSNTYWDWHLNQIGAVYGITEELFTFIYSFDEFPPHSLPPSFVPTKMMKQEMSRVKAKKAIDNYEKNVMPLHFLKNKTTVHYKKL